MAKIALSYRRSDSSSVAHRIYDRLAARYGADAVFIDVDDIPYGTDFRQQIKDTIAQSDVLLAIMGAAWLGAKDDSRARIDDKNDLVRIEVEFALQRPMPIIPVLVEDAQMPAPDELPRSLRDLAYLNAAEVREGRDFHAHVDRLIEAIDRIVVPAATNTAPAVADRAAASAIRDFATRYLAAPFVLLLIAHYFIVNAYNLDTWMLRAASIAIPFAFGFLAFMRDRVAPMMAVAGAAALGIVTVAAMTVSEGLNSGQPIMPATPFEWRENIEFILIIGLAFVVGHALARVLPSGRRT